MTDLKATLTAELLAAKAELASLRGLLGIEVASFASNQTENAKSSSQATDHDDEQNMIKEKAAALPPGWKEVVEKSTGKVFYYNKFVIFILLQMIEFVNIATERPRKLNGNDLLTILLLCLHVRKLPRKQRRQGQLPSLPWETPRRSR